ncbi:MAG: ribosome assembly RNA-binding protein YhbY [Chthoniobacter sp.]|jgi:RNA-binding protein|nr:ribosome assembly RNA-binding protein YhbY [Chthoniobacter sp.]
MKSAATLPPRRAILQPLESALVRTAPTRHVDRTMTPTVTNAELRELKARAQKLEPVLKLGHAGVTEGFLKSLDAALTTHGLVKMKFTDFKDQRKTLTPQIADQTSSAVVMQVGNVAVFYRPKQDPTPS